MSNRAPGTSNRIAMLEEMKELQSSYYPFFGNCFEFIITKLSESSIQDEDQVRPYKMGPSSRFADHSLSSLAGSSETNIFKFLVEKVDIESGSVSVKPVSSTVPSQLPIQQAKVPRVLTLQIRETFDLQVYRVFRTIFNQMYDGYSGIYYADSSNYLMNGFLIVYDTVSQVKGSSYISGFIPIGIIGFYKIIPMGLPPLELSWDSTNPVIHEVSFAVSSFDFLPFSNVPDLPGNATAEERALGSFVREVVNFEDTKYTSAESILFTRSIRGKSLFDIFKEKAGKFGTY